MSLFGDVPKWRTRDVLLVALVITADRFQACFLPHPEVRHLHRLQKPAKKGKVPCQGGCGKAVPQASDTRLGDMCFHCTMVEAGYYEPILSRRKFLARR